jgi:hypothetical protein
LGQWSIFLVSSTFMSHTSQKQSRLGGGAACLGGVKRRLLVLVQVKSEEVNFWTGIEIWLMGSSKMTYFVFD